MGVPSGHQSSGRKREKQDRPQLRTSLLPCHHETQGLVLLRECQACDGSSPGGRAQPLSLPHPEAAKSQRVCLNMALWGWTGGVGTELALLLPSLPTHHLTQPCTLTWAHTHMGAHTRVQMHTWVLTHTQMHTQVHTHRCTQIGAHTGVHTHMGTHTQVRTHMGAHTWTHRCTHRCTHTWTPTGAHTGAHLSTGSCNSG